MKNKGASNIIFEMLEKDSTVVLCGAGISRNSGIPTVDPFVDYILSKLEMDPNDIEIFKKTKLPFEGLMEQINRSLPIENLLDVFDVRSPNRNHNLLASLMELGFCTGIYTTNFDMNIELAASRSIDLQVVSLPDSLTPAKIKIPFLVKLHGTIQDKPKLGVTIKTIAAKEYVQGLEEWIKYLLVDGPHKNVLILGYSFSDRFDISPLMQKYASQLNKNVINIAHDRNDTSDTLESMNSGELRFTQLRTNTDTWVDESFKRFGIADPGKNPSVDQNAFAPVVDNWLRDKVTNKGTANVFSVVRNLFKHVGNREMVIKYMTRGIESGLLDADSMFGFFTAKAQALNNYRNPFSTLDESIMAMKSAIEWCKKTNRPDKAHQLIFLEGSIGTINGSIAYKYLRAGELGKSKEYFAQSEGPLAKAVAYFESKLSDEVCYDRYMGSSLDLAVTLRRSGRSDQAAQHYDKIIEAYKEGSSLGVQDVYTTVLYNYGVIYYSDREDYSEALKYFQSALRQTLQIAMVDRAFVSLRECIGCMRKLERIRDALELYGSYPYEKPPFEELWTYEV